MIFEIIQNTTPYTSYEGIATKVVGKTTTNIKTKELNDICICDFIRCEYKEPVFASEDPEEYKKDYSDFLFKRIIAADQVSIFIEKNNIEIAEITNDDYGVLYDGFQNGNEEQKLYYGFRS